MNINEEKALQTAWNAARAAGEEILLARHLGLDINTKKDGSFVTQGDQKAEIVIRELLTRDFPEIPIVGEEQGGEVKEGQWAWVVDPIDSTKNYIRGLPIFGVLIALARGHEPRVGVIYMPALGEGVRARKGAGCFNHRGEKQEVSKTSKISDCMINHGEVDYLLEGPYASGFRKLASVVHAVRGFGDFYGHMLVMAGQAEAMIDPIVNPWDVAPVQICMEEAGGKFTNLEGQEGFLGGSALSSNGVLHEEILKRLKD